MVSGVVLQDCAKITRDVGKPSLRFGMQAGESVYIVIVIMIITMNNIILVVMMIIIFIMIIMSTIFSDLTFWGLLILIFSV